MTRRTRFTCWILKATNTHSEYVTLIAFPRLQRLHERISVLFYTYYIAYLVGIRKLLIVIVVIILFCFQNGLNIFSLHNLVH
jgi:hypothetical protein